MSDYETMDEKDFLLEADKIAKASISRNNNQAAATKADTDDSSDDDGVNALSLKNTPPPTKLRSTVNRIPAHERRRRERDFKPRQPPLCYYYRRRFGLDAFRCLQPCSYKSKNL